MVVPRPVAVTVALRKAGAVGGALRLGHRVLVVEVETSIAQLLEEKIHFGLALGQSTTFGFDFAVEVVLVVGRGRPRLVSVIFPNTLKTCKKTA